MGDLMFDFISKFERGQSVTLTLNVNFIKLSSAFMIKG